MRHRVALISIIMTLIVGIGGLWYWFNKSQHTVDKIEVQFAYPVSSINPAEYDDWESVFIGNHIYYRLLPDENKPYLPYVTYNLNISCFKPVSSQVGDGCKEVKISFTPEKFTDCMGRVYSIENIRREFEEILRFKGWVVPQWNRCADSGDVICVTGKYVPDQLRRMRGIYFRFGWSKAMVNDRQYGAGPYCLTKTRIAKNDLYAGTLNPRAADRVYPIIKFHTSQNKNDDFGLAIYGNKSLLIGSRRNIQVHTPLAYYVVTNSMLDKYDLPWNTSESKKIIHDLLTEKDIFFSEIPQFVKFAPLGNADNIRHKLSYSNKVVFAIPDYLPACSRLAAALNEQWGYKSNARAICTDIVSYVNKNVIQNKSGWDGFFVGISAADPSHDALLYQYFSSGTSSSWTYDYPEPCNLFYLAGIGQSIATVDGKKICNIRPSPLGLSDLFVSDLLQCGG